MKFETSKLEQRQIDIWLCSIDCLDIGVNKDAFLKLLNAEERKRYERFVFEKDKNVLLASRYLLRSLLSAYHPEISPESWTFEFNDYGKPTVASNLLTSPLQFNLSHSRNDVVLAFSTEASLGIDIESFVRDSDLEKLARYSFSEKEQSQIEELVGDDFRDRFFSLWTLKEAYMKADGRGMSLPLKSFSFVYDDDNKYLSSFESEHLDPNENWLFWQYETELECFVSLMLRSELKDRSDYRIRVRKVEGRGQSVDMSLPLRKLAID